MMKKMLGLMIAAGLVVAIASTTSAAVTTPRQFNLDIKVLYNARQIASDVKPEVVNSTVFVPFRAVSDALGAQLAVTPDWKTITFAKGSRKVTVTIGSKTAVVNGKNVALTVAPYATKGRTMVPTRFVSEQLGESVEWDSLSRFVWIGHKNVPTLEEATEAKDIKPFLHYFKGIHADSILNNHRKAETYATVRVIREEDFPLIVAGDIYYRLDLVTTTKNAKAFRAVTTDKGVMGATFYLLQTGQVLKIRQPAGVESIGDIRIRYNLVTSSSDEDRYGIKDWDKLNISDAEYVGIYMPSDSLILVENYFDN